MTAGQPVIPQQRFTCVRIGVAAASVGIGGLLDGLGDDPRLVQHQNVSLLLRDLLRAQILVLEGYASDGRPA